MKIKIEYILLSVIAAAVVATLVLTSGSKGQLSSGVKGSGIASTELTKAEKKVKFDTYKEIAKPADFVNTNNVPITIQQYIGKKVILLDFVTYSCINCQRTFPYLNDWYKKYEDKGLVIIAIHTPEFAFEHLKNNVETAMHGFGIKFPIVLDNDYGTWNAYGNQYWPRKYLIDIDGYVVYDHIGEGKYDETEAKIVELLNERAIRLGENAVTLTKSQVNATTPTLTAQQSPETYLGSDRSEFEYKGTGSTPKDHYSLTGSWSRQSQYAQLTTDTGSIVYHFSAKKVHLVAESATGDEGEVYLDGKPIAPEVAGADVHAGKVMFSAATLYTIVDFKDKAQEHTLEIRFHKKGIKAYAFTFS